jgi:hypothetical protein
MKVDDSLPIVPMVPPLDLNATPMADNSQNLFSSNNSPMPKTCSRKYNPQVSALMLANLVYYEDDDNCVMAYMLNYGG